MRVKTRLLIGLDNTVTSCQERGKPLVLNPYILLPYSPPRQSTRRTTVLCIEIVRTRNCYNFEEGRWCSLQGFAIVAHEMATHMAGFVNGGVEERVIILARDPGTSTTIPYLDLYGGEIVGVVSGSGGVVGVVGDRGGVAGWAGERGSGWVSYVDSRLP